MKREPQQGLRIGALGICLAMLFGGSTILAGEEIVTPISTILRSSSSFHRRPVLLQGMVKALTLYETREILGRLQCAQGFDLDDGTGLLYIVWTSWCQIGEEKAVMAVQGESFKVFATIEAPPENVKDASGSEFVIKAVATKLMRSHP